MFLQASAGGTAGSSSGEQDCAQKGRREISETTRAARFILRGAGTPVTYNRL